jgi:hypothetical protein
MNWPAEASQWLHRTVANASWDFRQMVFFADLAIHSRKFHTPFILLIREHNACLEKGDKVLCLLQLWVLPLSNLGGGVWRFFFEAFFMGAPDSPSPSACRRTSLVWSTMAFDPTPGKTTRTGKMPFPPFNPSWHFSRYFSAIAPRVFRPADSSSSPLVSSQASHPNVCTT